MDLRRQRSAVTQGRASLGGLPDDLQVVVPLEAANFGRFMSEKRDSSCRHKAEHVHRLKNVPS